MKITDLIVDDELESEGVEIQITDEFSIRVRSLESKEFKDMHEKMIKPYENILRQGRKIPKQKAEEIFTHCLAETVLLGWKGLYGADGKEIKYSKENAKKYLKEARDLSDLVTATAGARANFRMQARDKAAKNSATS